MKRIAIIVLAAMLVFSGCGSVPKNGAEIADGGEGDIKKDVEKLVDDAQDVADDIFDELEPIGEIEIENELFDVTITLPAEFAEDVTQEELDTQVKEKGWKSATLNDDGSVTYVMTKKQHETMLKELRESLNQSLEEISGSEDYPNFVKITANDDFTDFDIVTKSTELDLAESFSVVAFYMLGGMYNIFAGNTVDNIHIDFINESSGEVISSADSKDMAE